ncbi:glucuronoxylan 4-O-methyltransferase 3 [Elaeis guineensis]|uniref:Glucuronoxylan 4-O-methyltransferase 3 n=1 Tax=Elaeis guineensis var. tenera TaxID=51953 RepID=A0A6I9RPV3_ELAGV|nr:glucuronoxylan 4-O-methyltransferase 3 [Elaeis guineensis]
MATMKPKVPNYLNLKLLILGFVLLFLILLLLRSNSSSPAPPSTSQSNQISPSNALPTTSCTKIPQSLANTIIHYATSNTTPQQTFKEISVTARVLEKKAPCNFLVFGLGRDSPMWTALNHGGRTVFLEEDMSWMETIQEKFPTLESYHVTYDTKVTQANDLLELRREPACTAVGEVKFSKCQLALKRLPSVFFEVEWDLIMVDAPTGWIPEAPGRMGAIYTAGMAARARTEGETDVFVHDVDRVVEDKFSKIFLCEGYLREQEGRLRHFTVPSHRTGSDIPFCP